MDLSFLPAVNASLNGLSGVLLCTGLYLIKSGRRAAHRRVMLGAFGCSILFLVSYLTYHAVHGSTRFAHGGPIRTVYLAILLTHTVLAAAVPPLAIVTLTRALRERFDAHRKVARITWPIWMYVSVTGVVIYLMLYHL